MPVSPTSVRLAFKEPMANPQKENGYVAIANEIWDALARVCLKSSERQVLDVIMRKTYGWNKKADNISLSQLQEATRLSKRAVIYAIQNLEAKSMLVVQRMSNEGLKSPSSIGFQKDYSLWVVQRNSTNYSQLLERQQKKYQDSGARKRISGAKNGKRVVQRTEKNIQIFAHTKDTSTKDIRTKDSNTGEPSVHREAVTYFCDRYQEKFSRKYIFVGGKDGTLIKAILKDCDIETFKKAVDLFLDESDDWIVENGHTIGAFKSRINRLVLKSTKPVQERGYL